MTANLFIIILTIGSSVSSLLTEAIKNSLKDSGKKISANLIALMNAIVIGCGGTALSYHFLEIPWTANNIICLVLMSACVWISEMVGYDKIIQLVDQIKGNKGFGA